MRMFSFNVRELERLSEKYTNHYDFCIQKVSALDSLSDNSLLFVNKSMGAELWEELRSHSNCLMILKCEDSVFDYDTLRKKNMVILSDNPRLDFARIFQFILDTGSEETGAVPARIGENFSKGEYVVIKNDSVIGDNVCIDDRVSIGSDVHIGNNCHIMTGAVIKDHVTLGNHCIVRENCVIGGWGFGFQRDKDEIPVRLPHIGGVVIGNYVEVGALTTIASGTFSPTRIGDYTKIDDHAHIAHNCHIGEKCYVMGGTVLCGSVKIGDRCHIAPQAGIIDGGITVGSDCTVGLGSVVKKSLADGMVVSGNPAKPLTELVEERTLHRLLKRRFHNEYLDCT